MAVAAPIKASGLLSQYGWVAVVVLKVGESVSSYFLVGFVQALHDEAGFNIVKGLLGGWSKR